MKKLLTILSFTIGITFTSFAQNRTSPATGPAPAKIIKFYPNPATAVINFDFQRGYDNSYTILIFNFMGKKVHEVKNVAANNPINLDNFYRGIYIFQLRDKNGLLVESGKFQVAK